MSPRQARVSRHVGVWLFTTAVVAMAACNATADSPPEASAASVLADTAMTTVAAVRDGVGTSSQVVLDDAAAPDAAGESVPSSSAVPSDPSVETDRSPGTVPAPRGLQVALGPEDWPGPLLLWRGVGGWPYGGSYEILEICERPELLAEWEAAGGPGALVPQFGLYAGERKRALERVARCTSDSGVCRALLSAGGLSYWPVGESPRIKVDRQQRCEHLWRFVVSAYKGTELHGTFFRTRSEAQQWADRWLQENVWEAVAARTVDGTATLGFHGSYGGGGHHLGCDLRRPELARGYRCLEDLDMKIRFPPADAPVDEVRVLADSVAVRDGVLRGLVRNWSRHLWAYGLTVTADGHKFEWPLSVQPGELAPFEIAGWDGPAEPERIDLRAAAHMSPHADPTRAFGTPGVFYFEIGADTRREMPDEVRDRFAHVTADVPPGSVSWAIVRGDSMSVDLPGSHPSLDDGYYERLVVDDLRAYGVISDSYGRVVDVGPATINVTNSFAGPDEPQYLQFTGLPALISDDLSIGWRGSVTVLFDVHVKLPMPEDDCIGEPGGPIDTPHVYYIDEIHEFRGHPQGCLYGDYGIWIGAAHP